MRVGAWPEKTKTLLQENGAPFRSRAHANCPAGTCAGLDTNAGVVIDQASGNRAVVEVGGIQELIRGILQQALAQGAEFVDIETLEKLDNFFRRVHARRAGGQRGVAQGHDDLDVTSFGDSDQHPALSLPIEDRTPAPIASLGAWVRAVRVSRR